VRWFVSIRFFLHPIGIKPLNLGPEGIRRVSRVKPKAKPADFKVNMVASERGGLSELSSSSGAVASALRREIEILNTRIETADRECGRCWWCWLQRCPG
jgi:hypothetical protein